MNQTPFAVLRRFVNRADSPAVELCELCAARLTPDHSHLLELSNRRIVCACEPCAILFSGGEDTRRYRRIPRRGRQLLDFKMDDVQWESLNLPINLAFFFKSSSAGRVVAMYPSPAGATESLLPLEAWQDLVAINPLLADFEPDVEALLVYRVGGQHEYWRAPIDECFRLVGLIRLHWHGLSGGTEVWREIKKFFAQLSEKSNGYS
jgi:hypothetical protein